MNSCIALASWGGLTLGGAWAQASPHVRRLYEVDWGAVMPQHCRTCARPARKRVAVDIFDIS